MKGRSLYDQLDHGNLKDISAGYIAFSQDELLQKLTGNELSSQGIVTLNSMHDRNKLKDIVYQKEDKLHDYVTHFSQMAEMMEHAAANDSTGVANDHVSAFAKAIKEKVEINRVKGLLKNALMKNMQHNKEERLAAADGPKLWEEKKGDSKSEPEQR